MLFFFVDLHPRNSCLIALSSCIGCLCYSLLRIASKRCCLIALSSCIGCLYYSLLRIASKWCCLIAFSSCIGCLYYSLLRIASKWCCLIAFSSCIGCLYYSLLRIASKWCCLIVLSSCIGCLYYNSLLRIASNVLLPTRVHDVVTSTWMRVSAHVITLVVANHACYDEDRRPNFNTRCLLSTTVIHLAMKRLRLEIFTYIHQ